MPPVDHCIASMVLSPDKVFTPLSDDCRQTMRSLLVVPNQLFGTTEAERALERQQQSSQASEVWHSCSGCMATPSQQQRKRGAEHGGLWASGGYIFRAAPGLLGGPLPRCEVPTVYQYVVLPFSQFLNPRVFTSCIKVPLRIEVPVVSRRLARLCPFRPGGVPGNVQVPRSHPGTGVSGELAKSSLTPTQHKTSLPIGLNLLALSTTEQMDWIRSFFLSFYLAAAPPVQVWLRLLGMLVAASALTPPRLLHLHMYPLLHRWVKVRVIPRCMALCYWRDVVYLQHRVPLGALKGLEPLIRQTLECPGSFYFEGLCLLATFYSMVQ
ncbi:hypothetical protein GOODEAATRI_028657 [Goodea atripinnis]|uniref:Uncharacterized protein n=1 Tax=Goodea atripinnis TaxID=208336 RepID=A0ABV0NEG3_9TELE